MTFLKDVSILVQWIFHIFFRTDKVTVSLRTLPISVKVDLRLVLGMWGYWDRTSFHLPQSTPFLTGGFDCYHVQTGSTGETVNKCK